MTPASLIPFHSLLQQEPSFSLYFVYVHIFICTSMLSLRIYRKHSTAQRNQPCTKQQSKYAPIRARQRKQADRVGESQHVERNTTAVSSITQLDVFSKKTKTSESARPTKVYNHLQSRRRIFFFFLTLRSSLYSWRDARRTGFYFQCQYLVRYKYHTTLLFLSVLFLCISLISYMHAASGLFSWSMGAPGICKSSVCT